MLTTTQNDLQATLKKVNFNRQYLNIIRTLLLFISTVNITYSQTTDKPLKKGDAFSVDFYFNMQKEEIAKNYGWSVNVTPEELSHYELLLEQIKNADSLTISKLELQDRFLVLGVRKISDIGEIWQMDGKKLSEFIFRHELDYPFYLKDLTIGKELFLSAESTKTYKVYKADLLYQGNVIQKNTVINIKSGESYCLPIWEFRAIYFKNIVAPAIQASGKSENEYILKMLDRLKVENWSTSLWKVDKSSDYYQSGKLKTVIPYKAGKIHGTKTSYYENGSIESIVEYIEGKAGIMKYYHENGKLKSTYLEVDEKTFSSSYSEEGVLEQSCEKTTKNGYQYGLLMCKNFYPNGKLKSEGGYGNFGAEGNWKFYDESGNLMSEQEYAMNMKSGKGKDYYPNGKLKAEYVYLMGNLESEKKY